jgi:serine protease Do
MTKHRPFIAAVVPALFLSLTVCASAMDFDAETVYESVVVVYAGDTVGSGFAVGEHCIITNAHVVADNARVNISTNFGNEFQAFVTSVDSRLDIAVLAVPETYFVPLKSADPDGAKIGDDVYTIGAPNSMAYTLTKGILSAKKRRVGAQSYLQTDAAINTGNSGGPLLNSAGEVLGMNTLKISNSEGIGLAIPITTVYAFLADEGIEFDGEGYVSEDFHVEDGTGAEEAGVPEPQPGGSLRGFSVLLVLLCCSTLLNMVLIIVLVYARGKKRYQGSAPSARTDFDIDILE